MDLFDLLRYPVADMPKYEYVCSTCGIEIEVYQRISEDPLTTCPKCNDEALERLISRSNFSLKGGGWYADGYGNSGSNESTSSTKSTSTASTETQSTSSESADSTASSDKADSACE